MSPVPLSQPPQTLFIRLRGQKKTLTGGYDLAWLQTGARNRALSLILLEITIVYGKDREIASI